MIFGLFKSARFSDSTLVELVLARGLWRGKLDLDSGPAPPAFWRAPIRHLMEQQW